MELGGFEPPTSWGRYRAAVSSLPLRFGFLMRCLASSGALPGSADRRGYASICGDSGTQALECPPDGVGYNCELAHDIQRVYIDPMARTAEETTPRPLGAVAGGLEVCQQSLGLRSDGPRFEAVDERQ
jgi:hypothetical protein